jgi:hypothetical protein
MNPMIGALTFAMAVALACPSEAGIFTTATRKGNFKSSSTALILVPLDDSGSKSVQFQTFDPDQPMVFLYNVECGVIGPSNSRVTVEIFIDGIQAEPASGTSFVLCTATDTAEYSWAGVVRQSAFTVPLAGTHFLNVYAAGLGGATQWWLGDSSLVVDTGVRP